MTEQDRIRENRLRRAAERQGLQLQRSRRRDHRATDYGTYQLVDRQNGRIIAHGLQGGYGLTLDHIEEQLGK